MLKRLLFRPIFKHPQFQSLWGRLHTLAVFGMNYGGGSLIETSGEKWVVSEVLSKIYRNVESPVIFDVGANIGDYSLLVKSALRNATVFAFEPAAGVFHELQARIAKIDGVEAFNIGFSDAEKSVVLHSYTANGEAASVLASIDPRLDTQVVEVSLVSTEQIDVTTIDRFCEERKISHIDFLKLDVEGHELAILTGAHRMLDDEAISLIQFEFGPANIYSKTYFYDYWVLLSEQFEIFRIIPKGIVPIRYYGEHREIFLTTNYLALRKGLRDSLDI